MFWKRFITKDEVQQTRTWVNRQMKQLPGSTFSTLGTDYDDLCIIYVGNQGLNRQIRTVCDWFLTSYFLIKREEYVITLKNLIAIIMIHHPDRLLGDWLSYLIGCRVVVITQSSPGAVMSRRTDKLWKSEIRQRALSMELTNSTDNAGH